MDIMQICHLASYYQLTGSCFQPQVGRRERRVKGEHYRHSPSPTIGFAVPVPQTIIPGWSVKSASHVFVSSIALSASGDLDNMMPSRNLPIHLPFLLQGSFSRTHARAIFGQFTEVRSQVPVPSTSS